MNKKGHWENNNMTALFSYKTPEDDLKKQASEMEKLNIVFNFFFISKLKINFWSNIQSTHLQDVNIFSIDHLGKKSCSSPRWEKEASKEEEIGWNQSYNSRD